MDGQGQAKAAVENLWTIRAFPVQAPTAEVFLAASAPENARRGCGRALRTWLRLSTCDAYVKSFASHTTSTLTRAAMAWERSKPLARAVHRYQEVIAGRPYQIEVAPVSKDRWRAYIVRVPGVPTALMPFYGATPIDAAAQLCQWLSRAHELASVAAAAVPAANP